MEYMRLVNGPIDENCYLAWDRLSGEGALIDPGFLDLQTLKDTIGERKFHLRYILNTHGHWDHVMKDMVFKEAYGAHIGIHGADRPYLQDSQLNLSYYHNESAGDIREDFTFADGDEIRLGKSVLKVMHTPGHTMGSVIFYNEELAFTGDTLFYGSIGRCDLPGSDKDVMAETIVKLKKTLPPGAKVLPGHGTLESTFREQLEINPFLTGKMKPK